MTQPPEEVRFIENVKILIRAVKDCLEKLTSEGLNVADPNLLILASNILPTLSPVNVIESFIVQSHLYWGTVNSRDEKYFISNAAQIFGPIPGVDMQTLKYIFESEKNGEPIIPMTRKNQIWSLLSSMIKISIKYIYKHKENTALPHSTLMMHAKMWNIILE